MKCPMCGAKSRLVRRPDVYRCRSCGELFIGKAEAAPPTRRRLKSARSGFKNLLSRLRALVETTIAIVSLLFIVAMLVAIVVANLR